MTRETFHYTAGIEAAGKTVEQFLSSKGYSRRLMIQLKKDPRGLTVGGEPVYVTYRLTPTDLLKVRIPQPESIPKMLPTPMDLSIVYEDQDFMVLNKPADMPIHPSQGNYTNTLANGVADYCLRTQEPFVYRAINRLDRNTTGLLIIAKHAVSACILSQMMRDRQIHRTYVAAVDGDVRDLFHASIPAISAVNPQSSSAFTIAAPIGRSPDSIIQRQVDFSQGEEAVTHLSFLSYHVEKQASLIHLHLETGRTHQIRVHMKYAGHPLFGDFLYNPDYRYGNRQTLHSYQLEFLHPITKDALAFRAAIPEDLEGFLS